MKMNHLDPLKSENKNTNKNIFCLYYNSIHSPFSLSYGYNNEIKPQMVKQKNIFSMIEGTSSSENIEMCMYSIKLDSIKLRGKNIQILLKSDDKSFSAKFDL